MPYLAPIDEMKFLLKDVFSIFDKSSEGKNLELDSETVDVILEEVSRLVEKSISPVNMESDKSPAYLEKGKVVMPHSVYGAYNDMRLTGLHETQSIDQFSYGVSDRGASIRIPIITVENGYKGWLEDRRPASNADPYKIAARIIKTVKSA